MMTEPPLDELSCEAREGRTESFARIVRLFERPIRGWLVRHSPPGVDADDVAQNTFVQAFERLSEYSPGTNFRAWLFAIARYQLRGEVTRVTRLADYHSRYAPQALVEELGRQAAEPPVDADELGRLRECVASLPEQARNVLNRRYGDGMALTEIAEALGRSPGAIKKQLFVLRRALHECLSRKPAGADR